MDAAAEEEGVVTLRKALRPFFNLRLDAEHVRSVVLDYAGDGTLLGPEFMREFQVQRAPITRSPLYPLTDLRIAPALVYLRTPRH